VTLPAFAYAAPRTVDDAVTLLSGDPYAAALAGGHALLYAMKDGREAPSLLVDLRRIPEVRGVSRRADGSLSVGAMTTLAELLDEPSVPASRGALVDAVARIGDPQVRNRATVGGNLVAGARASGPALRTDLPAVLLACDGDVVLAGPDGERAVPASALFAAGSGDLAGGRVLTRVVLPPVAPGWSGGYEKFRDRASLAPVVGVAVEARFADGVIAASRVAVTGSVPAPRRLPEAESALVGASASAAGIRAALPDLPASGFVPRRTASAEYLADMAKVLVRRALLRAAARASGGLGSA
jgi:carbon-monoxide dehydrogenase medium subunit